MRLPNGNDLSATALSDGEIVYLESNSGGGESGAKSDFPGFRYGRTDLAAIREALGSNGFAISGRMAEPLPDGAIALFNAYEVAGDEGSVAVFVTKVAASDAPAARAAPQRLAEVEERGGCLALAIATKYGLTPSIWTHNLNSAFRAARAVRSGTFESTEHLVTSTARHLRG